MIGNIGKYKIDYKSKKEQTGRAHVEPSPKVNRETSRVYHSPICYLSIIVHKGAVNKCPLDDKVPSKDDDEGFQGHLLTSEGILSSQVGR
jgi:hypothetical protein